jgi:dolichol-phosphate mannosyltransferase
VWQLARLRSAGPGTGTTRRCWYDIHGIITVASDHTLPELKPFRVRGPIESPTIDVRVKSFDQREAGELIDLESSHGPRMRYDEIAGNLGFVVEIEAGEQVRAAVSPLVATSPHVLYTNVVEPILRWKFVEKGYALVHAAAFAIDDKAYFVTARTDTGKTTTMLKVLQQSAGAFISDDLTLIDPSGKVLTYPKPMTISHHTVAALSDTDLNRLETFFLPLQSRLHSKTGREMALRLAELRVPVATLNTLVQRMIPPPKYRADKLVPATEWARESQLEAMFVIQRGDDFEHDLPHDEALDLLFENCEDAYGFPPYESLEALMLAAADVDLRLREREIVRSAFESCPSRLLSSSTMGWATDIIDHIAIDLRDDAAESIPARGSVSVT